MKKYCIFWSPSTSALQGQLIQKYQRTKVPKHARQRCLCSNLQVASESCLYLFVHHTCSSSTSKGGENAEVQPLRGDPDNQLPEGTNSSDNPIDRQGWMISSPWHPRQVTLVDTKRESMKFRRSGVLKPDKFGWRTGSQGLGIFVVTTHETCFSLKDDG